MWEMLAAAVGVPPDELKKFLRLAKSVDWANLILFTDLYTATRELPTGMLDGTTETQEVEVNYETAKQLQELPGWTLVSKRRVCQLTWTGPNPSNVEERVKMIFHVPLLTPITSIKDIPGGV